MRWREQDGVRWLEANLPGARAAFTTRLGGVSEAPFESLNLGLLTGDRRDHVLENRRRAVTAVGVDPEGVLIGLQVHGSEVAYHDAPPARSGFLTPVPRPVAVDGHATGRRALTPVVLVADCLPVALAGPRGVAMIHCGWRGLAAGLVAQGVAKVQATAAAIGPGIGPCCYEVGEEVLAAFESLGEETANGPTLDLVAIARGALHDAGVDRVGAADLCTSCNPELFFSHRRDGERTGRQAGMAWLR